MTDPVTTHPVPHLHRYLARHVPHLHRDWARSPRATSEPGLGPPSGICAGTDRASLAACNRCAVGFRAEPLRPQVIIPAEDERQQEVHMGGLLYSVEFKANALLRIPTAASNLAEACAILGGHTCMRQTCASLATAASAPLPHLHRDWAHPVVTDPVTTHPVPHLHWYWTNPCRICARTGLAHPVPLCWTAPGLGSPSGICTGTGRRCSTCTPPGRTRFRAGGHAVAKRTCGCGARRKRRQTLPRSTLRKSRVL